MNNETHSVRDVVSSQHTLPDQFETLREKSKALLDTLYDEIILWNIKRESMPLMLYLGMTPRDYLHFMQDPEGWAQEYLMRKLSSYTGEGIT